MAEPVIISYARGLLGQFPGVPEGIVDVIPVDLVVGAVCAVAAVGRRRTAVSTSPKSPRARSIRCGTAASSTSVASGSSNVLCTTRKDSRSSFVRGPSPDGGGCKDNCEGRKSPSTVPNACCSRCRCAASRPSSVLGSRSAARKPTRLSYVELYGAYAECEAVYGVDNLLALGTRSARMNAMRSGSTLVPSTGTTTCARCTCRPSCTRPGAHDGRPFERGEPRATVCAGRSSPRPAPRRVRSREHADRIECRGVVRVAGNPPSAGRRPGAARRPHARGGAAAAGMDRRDRGDFLRHFYRRFEDAPIASSTRTRSRCSAISSSRSRSPPRFAVCVSTGRSVTARCSSPVRWTSSSRRCAPCSTMLSALRSRRRPTDATQANSPKSHPPARREPRRSSTTRRPRDSRSRSPSHTPTRRPICRCSKPSGSPSR